MTSLRRYLELLDDLDPMPTDERPTPIMPTDDATTDTNADTGTNMPEATPLDPAMRAKLEALTPPLNPETDDDSDGGRRWDLPIEFSAVARMLSEAATNMAEMAKGYETFWDGGDDEDYSRSVAESIVLFESCLNSDAWPTHDCTTLLNAIQVLSQIPDDAEETASDVLYSLDAMPDDPIAIANCARLGFTDVRAWLMLSPGCLMGAGGTEVSATLDHLLSN